MGTDRGNISKSIREKARSLIHSGAAQSPLVTQRGIIATPIPIHNTEGDFAGWFVGVVVDGKIAGYFRFLNDLTLSGYSSFQRQSDSIDTCPDAKVWLDPDYILELARSVAKKGDSLAQPFLSYDQYPSRVAWLVPATTMSKKHKHIYVAGGFAYIKE